MGWFFLACATGGADKDSPPPEKPPVPTVYWATISGSPAESLGNVVERGGDLDGDGHADVLAAAYLGNRVCAIFGPLAPGDQLLDELPAACLEGEEALDYAGYGLAAPGDMTGDGAGDVLVSSIGNAEAGPNAGKVYLVPGPLSAGTSSLGNVFFASWRGENASDYAGISVGPAGDLSGDGEADLLVGASGYDGEGGGGGRVYLLAGPFTKGMFNLQDAYASVTGLGLPPAGPRPPPHGAYGIGDGVGDAEAGAADFNGDGLDDVALGAHGDQTVGLNAGKVAIFFGPLAGGAAMITDADVTLYGEQEESYTGSPLRSCPDLTGDGRDDILASADTLRAGVVYVISPTIGQSSVLDAALRFEGEEAGDLFGYALSSPADIDGDGSLDLGISAPASARTDGITGAFWWFSGPFSPGLTSTSAGQVFESNAPTESFGSALDVAGDMDEDGVLDLVLGARNSDANGGYSGRLYFFSL